MRGDHEQAGVDRIERALQLRLNLNTVRKADASQKLPVLALFLHPGQIGAVDVPQSHLMAGAREVNRECRAPRSGAQDRDRSHEVDPPLREKRRSSPRKTRRRFSRWRATTRIARSAPSQKIGLCVPPRASHHKAAAKAMAPQVEPKDT